MSAAPPLLLPQVTLCCVDSTARLPWALKALNRSLEQARFGEALLFTDAQSLGGWPLPEGVRWVEIEPLRSVEAYSMFMLKSLGQFIRTSHVLVIQWDGYIVDAGAWTEDFLACDYIGAPWHHVPGSFSVGNGGFSLRSRSLLDALLEQAFIPSHPEDVCIYVEHRIQLEALGLRFAPLELARRFAVEDEPMRPGVFGFHGPYHMPRLLTPEEALAFVETLGPNVVEAHYFGNLLRDLSQLARRDPLMKPAFAALERLILRAVESMTGAGCLTTHALSLSKALIRYGQFAAAGRLLRNRRLALGKRWVDPKLRLRLQARRLLAFARARSPSSRARR